jgi:DNA-binding transcriptional MerR regulator/DNA gyrase inhibitor GyrI
MFTIGEFSKTTGLPVKTLRFYHEKQLHVPAQVDAGSGYRHYNEQNINTARIIVALRELDFSLNEIAQILSEHDDDSDILEFLASRKQSLQQRINRDRDIVATINRIIQHETEARSNMNHSAHEIEEKHLQPQLVASIRMKCRYEEIGRGFSQIGRKLGRYISGKPLCLYYDNEYREEDADLEPCMPIRKHKNVDGISIRELPGGRCLALVHRGPYPTIGRSYERLLNYVVDHKYNIQSPTREVYLKGPGMIFRGNPKNYLTEIQFLIQETDQAT